MDVVTVVDVDPGAYMRGRVVMYKSFDVFHAPEETLFVSDVKQDLRMARVCEGPAHKSETRLICDGVWFHIRLAVRVVKVRVGERVMHAPRFEDAVVRRKAEINPSLVAQAVHARGAEMETYL